MTARGSEEDFDEYVEEKQKRGKNPFLATFTMFRGAQ